jgi:hypothetical protein
MYRSDAAFHAIQQEGENPVLFSSISAKKRCNYLAAHLLKDEPAVSDLT